MSKCLVQRILSNGFLIKNHNFPCRVVRNFHQNKNLKSDHFESSDYLAERIKKMSIQSTVDQLTEVCFDLRRRINSAKNESEKESVVLKHIKSYENTGLKVNDFSKGLEWFNVSESLSIYKHLAGKLIVLDFFTYCCINCMHILPDLDALEKEFSIEDGLVVIGVHSAKFANERDSGKILAAVQRYNISHPVVNDARMSMWQDIGVSCWPTMIILGPQGQPLFVFVGEGHREELFLYTKVALAHFKSKNQIKNSSIPLELAQNVLPSIKDTLLFPGKIHAFKWDSEEKLAVSDTGNNRILIMKTDGQVEHVIGGYSPGFKDGNFETARFNAPQGVCSFEENIFVADNENHAVRKINLKDFTVTTVAGTGKQGHDYTGGKIGKEQEISSPWDVALYYHDQGDTKVPVILIAIAGTHQIWALFLEDTIWWKKTNYKAGTVANIVGNGREANRNNMYAHASSLAQPSGLAVAQELKSLFFADSESSTIRRVCLDDGKVLPVCGADKNPQNLFGFGDVDGRHYSAKLQHPLGVAWDTFEKVTYIADTYNHKIKKVDVEGNCVTVCGNKSSNAVSPFNVKNLLKVFKSSNNRASEERSLFQWDEPSGLTVSLDGKILYVTDTNNHCVKTVNLQNPQNVNVLPVKIAPESWNKGDYAFNFKTSISTDESELTITFSPVFKNDLKLNNEAPQSWILYLPQGCRASETKGDLTDPISIKLPKGKADTQIHVTLNLMVCRADECLPKKLSVAYNLTRDKSASSDVVEKKELVVM